MTNAKLFYSLETYFWNFATQTFPLLLLHVILFYYQDNSLVLSRLREWHSSLKVSDHIWHTVCSFVVLLLVGERDILGGHIIKLYFLFYFSALFFNFSVATRTVFLSFLHSKLLFLFSSKFIPHNVHSRSRHSSMVDLVPCSISCQPSSHKGLHQWCTVRFTRTVCSKAFWRQED